MINNYCLFNFLSVLEKFQIDKKSEFQPRLGINTLQILDYLYEFVLKACTHSLSLFLSLSHTHTRTHTQTHVFSTQQVRDIKLLVQSFPNANISKNTTCQSDNWASLSLTHSSTRKHTHTQSAVSVCLKFYNSKIRTFFLFQKSFIFLSYGISIHYVMVFWHRNLFLCEFIRK